MPSVKQCFLELRDNEKLLDDRSVGDTQINMDSLESGMRFAPQTYLFWSQMHAMADDEVAHLDDHVELIKADCRDRARQRIEGEGEKATEKRLEDLLIRDPTYQNAVLLLKQAKLVAARIKSVEQALWQKQGILIALNQRQCKELS